MFGWSSNVFETYVSISSDLGWSWCMCATVSALPTGVYPLAGGISIPTSYTSYLAPICCPKLYSEVCLYRDKEKVSYFKWLGVSLCSSCTFLLYRIRVCSLEKPNYAMFMFNTVNDCDDGCNGDM